MATFVKKFLAISDFDPEIMAQMAKYGTAEKDKELLDADERYLINVEGRLNKKFKMNLSFHKRGMQGAKFFKLQKISGTNTYQMFQQNILDQEKNASYLELHPEILRQKVQEYLSQKKSQELAFSSLTEKTSQQQ